MNHLEHLNLESASIISANIEDFASPHWSDEDIQKEQTMLDKIIKATDSKGQLKTGYAFGKGKTKGRLYVKKGIGLQKLPGHIRNTIADKYIDIDIVNCFPTLLLNLCKKENYPHKQVELYVKNRTAYIAKYDFNVKITVNELMNNGKQSYNTIEDKPEWLILLYAEFNDIFDCLIRDNAEKYKAIKTKIAKSKNKKKENPKGTLMFEVMECIEAKILEDMFAFCKTELKLNTKTFVKMFDGFMALESDFTEEHLEQLNHYINTLHNVTVINKCMDNKIDLSEYEYVPPLADTDYDCAVAFKKYMEDNGSAFVKYINGKMEEYYFFNKESGIWVQDINQIRPYIHECDTISDDYRTGANKKSNLLTELKCLIELDIQLHADRHSSTYKHIAFNNGIYSFKDKKLLEFNKKFFFTTKLKADYNPNFDMWQQEEVKAKLLYGVFNEEVAEYFLKALARAMAGEINDKNFYIIVGFTNSGKGSLSDIIQKAFSAFCGIFSATSLQVKKNSSTDAKGLSWLYELKDKRFAIANEWNMEVEADGTFIKTITGGDDIVARQNYISEVTFKPSCTYFTFANDVPKISCSDEGILNRNKYMRTEYSYLSGEQYEAKKNNEYVKRADESIKDVFIRDPNVIQTFMYMVINAYEDKKPLEPKGVIEENQSWAENTDMAKELLKLFVEGNANDFISVDDFYKRVEKKKLKLSKNKVGRIMSQEGYKSQPKNCSDIGKSIRCYIGIKFKPRSEVDDINAEDDL